MANDQDQYKIQYEVARYLAKHIWNTAGRSLKTGYNLKTLNKSSNNVRKNWYNFYQNYVNNYFKDMPSGWYQSNERVKNILGGIIKL